jgi:hypothetical protein
MLATPLLLGVAVSGPDPWQLVVALAAVTGYLASATAQAWLRARRSPAYRRRLLLWAASFAGCGLALVVAWPELLLTLVVLLPAAAVTVAGARPGTPRDLGNSLAQVAQAVVLVPVTAWVSSAWDPEAVARMTVVAAVFLVGEVLVVRSVLRERGNVAFGRLSVGYHLVVVVAAAFALPPASAILAIALVVRAALLPVAQRHLAAAPHPLRPVHVGMIELACSIGLVVVAFVVGI